MPSSWLLSTCRNRLVSFPSALSRMVKLQILYQTGITKQFKWVCNIIFMSSESKQMEIKSLENFSCRHTPETNLTSILTITNISSITLDYEGFDFGGNGFLFRFILDQTYTDTILAGHSVILNMSIFAKFVEPAMTHWIGCEFPNCGKWWHWHKLYMGIRIPKLRGKKSIYFHLPKQDCDPVELFSG